MRQLNVKSPIDGIFVLYNWRMKPGKWLDKGTAAGEAFSPNTTVIYAYAKEKNIKDLKISDTVSVTGKISYREFTSAGLNFLRAVISILQRELAF